MSDRLNVILMQPTHSNPDPSYKFSHNPSKEWVNAFTSHLAELKYRHDKNKIQNPLLRFLWTYKQNFDLKEINDNFYKTEKLLVLDGFIKHIENDVMVLDCKWSDMLKVHSLVVKAISHANIDVPGSAYYFGRNGHSNISDNDDITIYQYLNTLS